MVIVSLPLSLSFGQSKSLLIASASALPVAVQIGMTYSIAYGGAAPYLFSPLLPGSAIRTISAML